MALWRGLYEKVQGRPLPGHPEDVNPSTDLRQLEEPLQLNLTMVAVPADSSSLDRSAALQHILTTVRGPEDPVRLHLHSWPTDVKVSK